MHLGTVAWCYVQLQLSLYPRLAANFVLPKLAQATFIPITEIYSKLVLHRTEQGFIEDSEFLLVTIRVLLLLVPLPSDELLACCSPHYSVCLQLQMGQSWLAASESLSGRQRNGRSLALGLACKQTSPEPKEIYGLFNTCLFDFTGIKTRHVNVQRPEGGLQKYHRNLEHPRNRDATLLAGAFLANRLGFKSCFDSAACPDFFWVGEE